MADENEQQGLCSLSDTDDDSPMDIDEDNEDENKPNKDICGDGSVLKTVLVPGSGPARPPVGAEVQCHYVGTLENGTQFDSSRDRNEPFTFHVGQGVITGWSDAIQTMRKGEKSKFIILPHKAYGVAGSPPTIPANATLHFEIELLSWTAEEDVTSKRDKGVLKTLLTAGSSDSYQKPNDLASVTAKVVLRCGGRLLLDRHTEPLSWVVDDGTVILGLDVAVKSMKRGEVATFIISPMYTQPTNGLPLDGLMADSSLQAELELIDFVKDKDSWEMNFDEKLTALEAVKETGNALFQSGDFERAIRRYERALKYFEYESSLKEDEKSTVNAKKVPCYLNKAMCQLKLRRCRESADTATKALEIDQDNVKGRYRRAMAYLELGEWDDSKRDFDKCLEIDSTNKSALQGLRTLKNRVATEKARDKQRYAGMFDRL